MNAREYGLGSSTEYVEGVPRIVEPRPEFACPHCGGGTLYQIEVTIKGHPQLKGGSGIGRYIGCAACPFASPMMMIAVKE